MRLKTRPALVLSVGYLLVVGAAVTALFLVRERVARIADDPQVQADWDQWVGQAEQQSRGEGPVRRRVPRSAEPPAWQLLRDFFPVCLAATIVFSSALYLTFAYLVRGVFASRPVIDTLDKGT